MHPQPSYRQEEAISDDAVLCAPPDGIPMTQDSLQSLRERLEMRERQLLAVHRVSAALFSITDLDALLRETLHVSLETVEADAGSILLYDAQKRRLVFRYVIGKTELIGQEIDPEEDRTGRAAEVFRTGMPLLTADTRREGHNAEFDAATGYRTQNLLTVPLKNLGGEPIGVMQALNKRGASFDTGDQELLEIICSLAATSIVNARLAEEAKLAEVARAVAELGHDIKNSLTPVETAVDTLILTFLDPALAELDRLAGEWRPSHPEMETALCDAIQPLREQVVFLREAVKDGCLDIREMTGAIADYIRGTEGINKEVAALGEVLEERLRRLQVVARDRRVTLHLEGCETVPPFAFDRRLIGRALFNLVSNALAAIEIAVRNKTLELRPFHIWVRAYARPEGVFPEGGYCCIEVKDDGPGIPERVKKVLFTPHTITTTPGGSGIGTQFVKSVADAHGGVVGVESEVSCGARFWMKLPLR